MILWFVVGTLRIFAEKTFQGDILQTFKQFELLIITLTNSSFSTTSNYQSESK